MQRASPGSGHPATIACQRAHGHAQVANSGQKRKRAALGATNLQPGSARAILDKDQERLVDHIQIDDRARPEHRAGHRNVCTIHRCEQRQFVAPRHRDISPCPTGSHGLHGERGRRRQLYAFQRHRAARRMRRRTALGFGHTVANHLVPSRQEQVCSVECHVHGVAHASGLPNPLRAAGHTEVHHRQHVVPCGQHAMSMPGEHCAHIVEVRPLRQCESEAARQRGLLGRNTWRQHRQGHATRHVVGNLDEQCAGIVHLHRTRRHRVEMDLRAGEEPDSRHLHHGATAIGRMPWLHIRQRRGLQIAVSSQPQVRQATGVDDFDGGCPWLPRGHCHANPAAVRRHLMDRCRNAAHRHEAVAQEAAAEHFDFVPTRRESISR